MSYLCGIYNYLDLDSSLEATSACFNKTGMTELIKSDLYYDKKLIVRVLTHQEENKADLRFTKQDLQKPSDPSPLIFLDGEFFTADESISCYSQFKDAWVEKGVSSLNLLNGNWCCVIWDHQKDELFLARDPYGINKLYFSMVGKQLYFSTSLKFCSIPDDQLDLNSVADFLRYLYIPAPATIFKNVKALLPGEVICYKNNSIKPVKYAAPVFEPLLNPRSVSKQGINIEDEVNELESLIFKSVEDRLSDKESNFLLLSGGKDSSILAAAIKHANNRKTTIVNVGFHDQAVDESADCAEVAKFLEISYRSYTFNNNEYIKSFYNIIKLMEQPFGDPSFFPLCLLNKELDCGNAIILDGTGNDSYFGIPPSQSEITSLKIQSLIPDTIRAAIPSSPFKKTKYFSLTRKILDSKCNFFTPWTGWNFNEINKLISYKRRSQETEFFRTFQKYNSEDISILKLAFVCGMWEIENVFRRTMESSVAFGAIARFPYTDTGLVKYVHSLPPFLKTDGKTNKILLRALMQKHLPHSIISKPKGKLIFDINILLSGNKFELLDNFMSEQALKKVGLFHYNFILSSIRDYKEGNLESATKLYAILLLQGWLMQK